VTLTDPYIVKRCSEIEGLLVNARVWASNNEKLGAHMAAYISVLILGVLEDCTEHLVAQRVDKTGDNEIKNYITKVIGERFKNPDWGAISGLLGEFSQEYKVTFAHKIAHDGTEATALQGIVDNKNSLAHLGTSKLNLSIEDVQDYYSRITPILESLEQILG
jgi:hypothetical protein